MTQLKKMFANASDLRQQDQEPDKMEEEVRQHIRHLERHVANTCNLDLDDVDYDEKLSRYSHEFMELNSTAVTACMKLRRLYQA